MRAAPIAGIVLAGATSMALAADTVQMKPGRWVETITATSVTLAGQTLDSVKDNFPPETKYRCVTAAEGADPKAYFATVKKGDSCATPTGTVGGGKMLLKSHCAADPAKGQMPDSDIEVSGTYGLDSYAAAARLDTMMGKEKFVVNMSIAGKYEGACKGDES